jgi:K+-transporting ATPase ATPase C chain
MSQSLFRPALVLIGLLTLVTGGVYPLVVTGLALAFPDQRSGSIVFDSEHRAIGSRLIGQSFSDTKYFWSRPSATSPQPYNALASGGSNRGPLNPALLDAVKARVAALHAADPENRKPVPVDLVTASASGLDPHISVAAASYQISRVAHARALSADAVQRLVNEHTEGRLLGFIGEPRVNVLNLNLALDRQAAH